MSRIEDKRDEVPGNRAHSKVQDLIPEFPTPILASLYLWLANSWELLYNQIPTNLLAS